MTKIQYLIGDATEPVREDGRVPIIVHGCNDRGGWGAGFVLALSAKSPEPEQDYLRWAEFGEAAGFPPFIGGQMIMSSFNAPNVNRDTWVCSIISQHGTGRDNNGLPPVRYLWIATGFQRIAKRLSGGRPYTLHMPRIGCGLAGGDWRVVEQLIEKFLCERGIPVYVYDLPQPLTSSRHIHANSRG